MSGVLVNEDGCEVVIELGSVMKPKSIIGDIQSKIAIRGTHCNKRDTLLRNKDLKSPKAKKNPNISHLSKT